MFVIDLPPGVENEASRKSKTANWRETNLVRWERNTMKPVGGWEELTLGVDFGSDVRRVFRWIDNSGNTYTAYLCEEHCYVYDHTNDVTIDISPSTPLTPPISGDFAYGGYGDGAYGAGTYGTAREAYPKKAAYTPCFTLGNWGQNLLAMNSADGRLLQWSPLMASYDAGTDESTGTGTATESSGTIVTTSAGTGNIGIRRIELDVEPNVEVVFSVDIENNGSDIALITIGTTAGGTEIDSDASQSDGTYTNSFTPTTSPVYIDLKTDDASDFVTYTNLNFQALLTIVPNAPENNRSFEVTDERHVMLFGAGGDFANFSWCDQEDITDWNFASVSSRAGEFDVEPRSPIVAQWKIKNGIAMFTNRSLYLISYVGLPYVYAYERVSDVSPPYSFASLVETPDMLIWPSPSGWWAFNGVSVEPMDCKVWDWIVRQINESATRYFGNSVNVSTKSEIWWFFSTTVDTIPDRYVSYNYKYNRWAMGKMSRQAGLNYPNEENPILTVGTTLYMHESGYSYPGSDENPWAETFTINFEKGWRKSTIKKLLPEVTGDYENLEFSVAKLNNPSGGSESYSTARNIRANGYVDIRETARDIRLRVEYTGSDYWTFGVLNVDAAPRGMGQ